MNVKITMEIPVEKLTELQAWLSSEQETLPSAAETLAKFIATGGEENKPESVNQKVTKTMIRAKGIELTQAGKKAELNEVFRKFGAEKLSAIKEEDYTAVYAALGAL